MKQDEISDSELIVQIIKIFIGTVLGIILCFLLWKIDKNQVTQIYQNTEIIKLLAN